MTNQTRLNVFPAHAGMSPVRLFPGLRTVGFPRSRGDEPEFAISRIDAAVFSPLTRG